MRNLIAAFLLVSVVACSSTETTHIAGHDAGDVYCRRSEQDAAICSGLITSNAFSPCAVSEFADAGPLPAPLWDGKGSPPAALCIDMHVAADNGPWICCTK